MDSTVVSGTGLAGADIVVSVCRESYVLPERRGPSQLTTTQGFDVVLLIVECGYSYCPITISSIIDSSGLTFTQRVSYAPNDKLWEYYARPTSPLKSDNITVVFSADATIGIQVLAIHGP